MTITIIEKSKIIQDGLYNILYTNRIARQVIFLDNIADLKSLKEKKIDLLIISPDNILHDSLDKLRAKLGIERDIPVLGIVYKYYEPTLLNVFSEIIYITDREQVIINKITKQVAKQNKEEDSGEPLSEREKDVLKLLLFGLSNKEAAEKLSISPHTVITHRKNIIEKTGIRSLAGLAVYAIINNIADMNEIKN